MPAIITQGSMSTRGFGFGASAAGAKYRFVASKTVTSGGSSQVYGGNTLPSLSLLPNQPTSPPSVQYPAFAVDGSFIAHSAIQYSLNGGVSWTQWSSGGPGPYTVAAAAGLNGYISYNPTAKIAVSWNTFYNNKGGYFVLGTTSITSLGVVTNVQIPQGPNTNVQNTIYSPALNTFYIMNYGNGGQSVRYIDGSTGAGGTSTSVSPIGTYVSGVTNDGYPIQAAYAGFGSTFYLRKYLSQDLSSYVQLGTISDSYGAYPYNTKSPWWWMPINGRYYSAAGVISGGGSLVIRRSTDSSDPQNLNYAASINLNGQQGVQWVNMLEDASGVLWVFGKYSYYNKGTIYLPFTYYSNDGGITWTIALYEQYSSISKNFNF
jgi:hypothetical protein